MRTLTLALTLALVSLPLLALAPTASAFDYCVEGTPRDCYSHAVCIGRGYNAQTGEERCQYGIRYWCLDCLWLP